MSKLERWLTLVANLSVVAGIVFLAVEMRMNTDMMRAQIRDSITEKEMEMYGWLATSPDLAEVQAVIVATQTLENLSPVQFRMWYGYANAVFREWENFFYQYQQGLFDASEFEARSQVWRVMQSSAWADMWTERREQFAPSFRAEIDRIVAEVEQAQ